MAEHVALDLEVDTLHHLVQVGFEQRNAGLRAFVLSLNHKVIHQFVLGVCLGLEEAGSDDLLIHDGDIFTGEDRAAAHALIELRHLHSRAAAKRIECSGGSHIALKGGPNIAVLIDIAIDKFVQRRS